MGKKITNFLTNFQDMYVNKRTTIENFPNNITGIELSLLDLQLTSIKESLDSLSFLTKEATEENLYEYKKTIEILENKIDYISEVSNMLLYVNSFYDMSNVVDIKNYNLRDSSKNSSLVFDSTQKGLTLRNVENSYQCSKEQTSGTSVTFYNTNLTAHSGISLDTPYLDLIDIKAITLRKIDGTIFNLPIDKFNKDTHYIRHDYLTSTQIIIDFYVDVTALPVEQQEYYNSLKLSLIDYKYIGEGNVVLDTFEYSSSDIFNYIYDYSIPSDCFINNLMTIDLLDINKNKISTVNLDYPIGNPLLCRRLDNLNFNTVEEIKGIYMNNSYRSSKKAISREYLQTLNNKNEVFIVYLPKITDTNKANNYIRSLNNQGFILNNKNVKYINLSICIEMYSFNEGSAPILKTMAGVTKYE